MVTALNDYRFIQIQHPEDALAYLERSFYFNCRIEVIIPDFNHLAMNAYEFTLAIKILEIKYKRDYKFFCLDNLSGC